MTPVGVFFICQNEDKCHFVNSTKLGHKSDQTSCLLNRWGKVEIKFSAISV